MTIPQIAEKPMGQVEKIARLMGFDFITLQEIMMNREDYRFVDENNSSLQTESPAT